MSNEKGSEFALCDKGILTSESWVRFTGSGGTVIPNNPPQAHHCGTKSSGWIRGAHPAVAEGVVQRELCYRYNENECGFDSYEISIRNCGSFFVYKPPDLTECYLRLCTGVYFFSIKLVIVVKVYNKINISVNMMGSLLTFPRIT